MAVRLSALRAGRPLPTEKFLVLISVTGRVDPRAIVRLEGLGQLKNIHLIGTRTRLNQLRYRVTPPQIVQCTNYIEGVLVSYYL
jgi:hypothetical protein